MITVITFLASRLGQGVVIVSALVLAYLANNAHQRSVGAERVVAKMERAADAKATKAETARRSVDKLPDDRLRDRHFRD